MTLIYEALLVYRSTPLENGYSPTKMCMGRKLRTTLPAVPSKLVPHWPYLDKLRRTEAEMKEKQMNAYNRRHKARNLEELKPEDKVWLTDRRDNGIMVRPTPEPRSYIVETDTSRGVLRRNRRHLVHNPKEEEHRNDPAVTPSDTILKSDHPNQPLPAQQQQLPVLPKTRDATPQAQNMPTQSTPVCTTRSGAYSSSTCNKP